MNKKNRFLPGMLLGAFLLAAPAAVAQSEAPRPGTSDVDRELQETLEHLMLLRFQRQMELTQEQKEQVLPLLEELIGLRRQYARERAEGIHRLMTLSRSTSVDESRLRRQIETFDEKEASFRREEHRLGKEMRSHLSLRQQARLLAFEEQFRAEMRRRFQEARRGGGPAGRGRRPRRGAAPAPRRPAPR
ncbi:MAG: hypothetical protein ACE5HD_01700 [Acidobacteriota bacterium]